MTAGCAHVEAVSQSIVLEQWQAGGTVTQRVEVEQRTSTAQGCQTMRFEHVNFSGAGGTQSVEIEQPVGVAKDVQKLRGEQIFRPNRVTQHIRGTLVDASGKEPKVTFGNVFADADHQSGPVNVAPAQSPQEADHGLAPAPWREQSLEYASVPPSDAARAGPPMANTSAGQEPDVTVDGSSNESTAGVNIPDLTNVASAPQSAAAERTVTVPEGCFPEIFPASMMADQHAPNVRVKKRELSDPPLPASRRLQPPGEADEDVTSLQPPREPSVAATSIIQPDSSHPNGDDDSRSLCNAECSGPPPAAHSRRTSVDSSRAAGSSTQRRQTTARSDHVTRTTRESESTARRQRPNPSRPEQSMPDPWPKLATYGTAVRALDDISQPTDRSEDATANESVADELAHALPAEAETTKDKEVTGPSKTTGKTTDPHMMKLRRRMAP
ncbi:hypothetical protein C8T65DRAFT_699590 [Cerioporus squamosus]|nr:hypothetical protein C8T65DRAFT_699590 [Cerioporus squamosus]